MSGRRRVSIASFARRRLNAQITVIRKLTEAVVARVQAPAYEDGPTIIAASDGPWSRPPRILEHPSSGCLDECNRVRSEI